MNKYSKEIIDYCMDRELQTEAIPVECDCCKETSIFVEECDTSYRNFGASEHLVPLCIYCYYYNIVIPMDEQWTEYYAAVL